MRDPQPIPLPCPAHPEQLTPSRCEGCLLPFCPGCVVGIAGRRLCAACKFRALREIRRRTGRHGRDADEALVFSLMATVPFLTPFFAPFAFTKGVAVLASRRRNPSLPGCGKAIAAVLLSTVGLGVWILGALWLLRR